MKEVTIIETVQVTRILKNVKDHEANFYEHDIVNALEKVTRYYKDIIDADDVRVTDFKMFFQDKIPHEDNEKGKKQREIRELTERLLKLVSE